MVLKRIKAKIMIDFLNRLCYNNYRKLCCEGIVYDRKRTEKSG